MRRIRRRVVCWALLADAIPIYPLYALLFASTGLSAAQISGLFLVWSVAGIVAEVPSGALADRWSRRAAMVAAGVSQAVAYVLWVASPGYAQFAAGFAIWAVGGALSSGALEALLYDTLTAEGDERHYPTIYGQSQAASLLAQLPAAAAATVLFPLGGFALVGWASIACCLGAAVAASRLPEQRTQRASEPPDPPGDPPGDPSDRGDPGHSRPTQPSYLRLLRDGVREAATQPAVRAAALAAALVGGFDALEEYFPLLAGEWGVATAWVPVALVATALTGATGAALGGLAERLDGRALGLLLGAATLVFAASGLLARPVGVAGIAIAYGLYRLVLVVVDTRLQSRIEGEARATVTSVANLGVELTGALVFGLWALRLPGLLVAVALVVAARLPTRLAPG